MAEILNAYDSNHTRYRITDILKVEARLHQITPDLGLLSPSGIDSTVAQFGFKATHLTNPSPGTIIAIARSGNPVIINFPPYLWSGGHILVLRGAIVRRSPSLTPHDSICKRCLEQPFSNIELGMLLWSPL